MKPEATQGHSGNIFENHHPIISITQQNCITSHQMIMQSSRFHQKYVISANTGFQVNLFLYKMSQKTLDRGLQSILERMYIHNEALINKPKWCGGKAFRNIEITSTQSGIYHTHVKITYTHHKNNNPRSHMDEKMGCIQGGTELTGLFTFVVQVLHFYNTPCKYDNVHVAARTSVKAVLNVSSTGCNNEWQSSVKLSYSVINSVLTKLLPAGLHDFFHVLNVSNATTMVNSLLECSPDGIVRWVSVGAIRRRSPSVFKLQRTN